VKFGRVRAAAIGGLLSFFVSATGAPATTVILNAAQTFGANNFAYEVEPGAGILANGNSQVPGAGKLIGSNIVFYPGAPAVADFGSPDPFIGAQGSTGRPPDIIAADSQITAQVISSGNLYQIDLLSFLRDSGACLDNDGGQSCAAAGGFSSFDITATTPLPAALPLFATGLGALGLLGRRRKRKAAAVA
jgi:hypothetical protein